MATFVVALALASAADALVARGGSCCFGLTGAGGVSGTVGQLGDGQSRILGGLGPAQFCVDQSGAITDSNGRGCWFTPPTSQWQCDTGRAPAAGFTIGCDGRVTYGGVATFWSCPTGDNGGYNIYQTSIDSSCVQITLGADKCHANCPAPAPAPPIPAPPVPAPPVPAPPVPAPPGPGPSPPPNACPADLHGPYEFPHLIIPLNSGSPDQAPGTSFFGEVSGSISSVFNFDIPAADNGKTCSLEFLFPQQNQLQTSSYTFSGSGHITFGLLDGTATSGTTFNNVPRVRTDYGVQQVAPGHAYPIASFPCPGGQAISFVMRSQGDTCFRYFQDYNPCPIGLYITKH